DYSYQDEVKYQDRLHDVIMAANEAMDLTFEIPKRSSLPPIGLANTDFQSIGHVGNSADQLFKTGRYKEAISRYSDCVREMQQLRCIDSFIMAKVTLGTLLALVCNNDLGSAYEV